MSVLLIPAWFNYRPVNFLICFVDLVFLHMFGITQGSVLRPILFIFSIMFCAGAVIVTFVLLVFSTLTLYTKFRSDIMLRSDVTIEPFLFSLFII